jgi:ATP-dependent Clp protease ATP-binding subunit ClpA
MFERFTAESRRVVVHAQEEARLLGHDHVGSEHILLGLMIDDEGLAARALVATGITLEAVRERVSTAASSTAAGGTKASGDTRASADAGASAGRGRAAPLPFTPRAKKILERSLREALRLGSNDIGNEHILLGLLGEPEGAGIAALAYLGVLPLELRRRVLKEISGAAAAGSPARARTTIAEERPWTLPPERVGVVRIGADAVAGLRILLESIDRRLAATEAHLALIEAHLGIKAPAEPKPDGGTGEAPAQEA